MMMSDFPGFEWAVITVLVAWCGLFYGFLRMVLGKRQQTLTILLAGLIQGLVVLGILIILWNPCSRTTTPQTIPNRVLVVMDTSQSMSIADIPQGTRLSAATTSFSTHANTQGDRSPQFEILGLDTTLYRCQQCEQLTPSGSHSRLNPLLQGLSEENAAKSLKDVVGVLLFTDGQFEDSDLERAQRIWPDSLEPIIIGVGSPDELSDLRIVDVRTPARVPLGTVCPIDITVASSQAFHDPIQLDVLLDDLILETVTLPPKDWLFDQGQVQKTITCQWSMIQPGEHLLGARLAPHADDLIPTNNEGWTQVEVTEAPMFRVLLYSQRLSMQVGKLRRVLESDPTVMLDLCLDVIKNDHLARYAGLSRQSVAFPTDLEPYDLIVMATSQASQWNSALIDNLYDYVVHHGGGLLLLTDPVEPDALRWKQNRLRQLLPIIDPNSPSSDNSTAGMLHATPEALKLGMVTNTFFQTLDLPVHAWNLGSPKPASTTLFEVEQKPTVLMHRVGQGHVCLMGLSKLFQLYREDRHGGTLYELINPLIRRLAPQPGQESGMRVFAERMPGRTDDLTITAWIEERDHQALDNAEVLVSLNDQTIALIPLGQGQYQATVPYSGPQCLVVRAQAQSRGTYLGEAVTVTRLPSLRSEMSQTRLNEPLLKNLAQILEGQYLPLNEVDHTLFDRFQGRRQTRPIEKVTPQWPRWPIWAALCLLLCMGWTIRRSIGLG